MDTVTALQTRALELTEWLETLPRTFAAPLVVKIGREVYAGASYAQVRDTPEATPARWSGERYYCQRAIYLIGRLPYSYRRRRSTCYRVAGGRFPWFIAGWYDVEAITEHHPFGPMFQLMPDTTGVCVSDNGEPYRALPLELIG